MADSNPSVRAGITLRQVIAERQVPETRCMGGMYHRLPHVPCRRRQFTRASILFDSWGCIRLLNQVEFASNSQQASGGVMSPCRSAMACLQACLPAPSAEADLSIQGPGARWGSGLGWPWAPRPSDPISCRLPAHHPSRQARSRANKMRRHLVCLVGWSHWRASVGTIYGQLMESCRYAQWVPTGEANV